MFHLRRLLKSIFFKLLFIVFFTLTTFTASFSKADQKEDQTILDSIKVTWADPKGGPKKNKNNVVLVSFTGKAKKGTSFYLDTLKEIKDDKFSSMKNSSSTASNSDQTKKIEANTILAKANEKDEFNFELELKPGRHLLRVKVAASLNYNPSLMKTYEMILTVSANYKVEFNFAKYETNFKKTSIKKEGVQALNGKNNPFSNSKKNIFSLGAGLNYSYFNKSPNGQDKLSLSLFKIPFFHFEFEKEINTDFSWSLSSMLASGEVTKTSNITLGNSKYQWSITTGDLLYSKENWIHNSMGLPIKWGLRGGLQAYSVPFVKNKSSDGNVKDLISLSFSSYSLGFDVKAKNGNKHLYEMMMRFSSPLSLSSEMNTSQFFSFDGSLGWTFLNENSPYSWGLFWYGHWVEFSYKEDNSNPLLVNQGKNQDLYSNLELRWMWNF